MIGPPERGAGLPLGLASKAAEPSPFSNAGFGREATEAMVQRRQWLIEQGFMREEEGARSITAACWRN